MARSDKSFGPSAGTDNPLHQEFADGGDDTQYVNISLARPLAPPTVDYLTDLKGLTAQQGNLLGDSVKNSASCTKARKPGTPSTRSGDSITKQCQLHRGLVDWHTIYSLKRQHHKTVPAAPRLGRLAHHLLAQETTSQNSANCTKARKTGTPSSCSPEPSTTCRRERLRGCLDGGCGRAVQGPERPPRHGSADRPETHHPGFQLLGPCEPREARASMGTHRGPSRRPHP